MEKTAARVALKEIVVNSGILYIEFAETLLSERIKAKQGLAKPGEKSYSGLTRQAFQDCLAQAARSACFPSSSPAAPPWEDLFPWPCSEDRCGKGWPTF